MTDEMNDEQKQRCKEALEKLRLAKGNNKHANISDYEPEQQIEMMQVWFFTHYSDPADCCPYETLEGDYLYLWGGPYEADDVLNSEFCDKVPEEVIQKLVDKLDEECYEWSAASSRDEDYYDAIEANINPLNTLDDALHGILGVASIEGLGHDAGRQAIKLSFIGVISALEVFLSDLFMNTVLNNEKFLRRFVETNPEFKQRSITLSEIFQQMDDIKERMEKYLSEISWHNIAKVKPIYEKTFQIKMPDGLKDIAKAVSHRHSFVHRGGKDKNGDELYPFAENVRKLVNTVLGFAKQLDEKVKSSSK